MIIETINKLKDVLINDYSITAWCQEKYEKAQTVYEGVNNHYPIESLNYPVITLTEIKWIAGERPLSGSVFIAFAVGVKNDKILDADGNELVRNEANTTNAETLPGLTESIEFLGVVQEAIREAQIAGTTRKLFPGVDFSAGNGTETFFPRHIAYTEMTLGLIDDKNNNL